MKKIISNNRIIAIAFLTVFTVALAPAAMAIEKKPLVPAELVFVGNIKNQPLFQLTVAGSAAQNEFTINITDEFGVSLYRENIKGENFSKKFLLNTDEIGDNTLTFEVFCKNTKQSVTYEVNRNSRFVQDLAITKK
ncbi:hypothetical protein CAP36_04610 [Chitinophagaceae bacterium IBVUCB2]|nr:hypothetical protein CAP36_04610 [Chitinophagaceae bacterium IBVUCB2]